MCNPGFLILRMQMRTYLSLSVAVKTNEMMYIKLLARFPGHMVIHVINNSYLSFYRKLGF